MNKYIAILFTAILSSGCATVIEGIHQDVSMRVVPEDATCIAKQSGLEPTQYDPASRTIRIRKSRRDLFITCKAPNYKDAYVRLVSEASAWAVVGGIGPRMLIDWTTGALNKYPNSLQVTLEPLIGPPATAPTVPASAANVVPGRSQSNAFPPIRNYTE